MKRIITAFLELLLGALGQNLVSQLNDELFEKAPTTVNIFDDISGIFNINYSIENPILPYKVICEIDKQTNFALVDTIIWKKKNGIPFPANKRRLSRLFENIFIFARKSEVNSFNTNRQVKSISEKTGQKYYEIKYNHVEAANNDGKCSLNQATYSSELCRQLLDIYALPNSTVYDPFMGTGTTAVACKQMNLNYIGSEISLKQCEYAKERLNIR